MRKTQTDDKLDFVEILTFEGNDSNAHVMLYVLNAKVKFALVKIVFYIDSSTVNWLDKKVDFLVFQQ